MISKPTVNCEGAPQPPILTAFDEAHAHARGLAGGLADEAFGATPGTEAAVVIGGLWASGIAMRTPAVALLGAGKFRNPARLRAAGEAAGIVRRPAVTQRGQNIATAKLVAKEMRRRRHHGRVRRFCRHPVDPGEMESADAAGLVAAGTGDVVEPTLEAADR